MQLARLGTLTLLGLAALAPGSRGQDAPLAASAVPPASIAFIHVAVVPMDREVVLGDQTVVVSGGRVEALGPSGEVAVPAGAFVVDARGKWLMPGLADMHVHTWSQDDLYLFVPNGVTAIRHMFGSPLQLQWRARIDAGELVGPRIHTAGPIVDGDPPVWPNSRVLTDPADADALVAEQKQAGYDFIKPYAELLPEAYDALAAAARKHGLVLMGHVPERLDLDHVLRAGQRTIEHLNGYAESAQADKSPFGRGVDFTTEDGSWKHVDEAKIAALAERTREAGAWNCPTLVVLQKWVQGEAAEALLADPRMRYVSPMTRAAWSPTSPWNYLSRLPADRAAEARDSVPARMRAVLLLHEAGARILAGTDMGNPYVMPGFGLHEELANLVLAGLSPYEALRAATSGAAECLGADWGVVAPGRRADLLLLDADPLADVTNAARRAGVMVKGRWFSEEVLRAELEARAQRWEDASKK